MRGSNGAPPAVAIGIKKREKEQERREGIREADMWAKKQGRTDRAN
jgi:hypothetical protein